MNQTISFKDLFKNNMLKADFWGPLNFSEILIGLTITFVIAMFIFYIYKETYSGVVYNHHYNVSIVLMALLTSLIIATISSNLVLSLGMVGALSIVRFRTPVKEPMDIIFMFWAVALGITTGAKLYLVGALGSLFTGLVTVVLLRFRSKNNMYLLIAHYEEEAKDNLLRRLSELDYTLKSKTVSNQITELTLELRIIGNDTSFVEQLAEIEGMKNVSLVSYNGNFIG